MTSAATPRLCALCWLIVGVTPGFGFPRDAGKTGDPFLHRLTLFAGGDAAYNFISTDAPGELDKHGYQLDAKGTLSYSWRYVTADAGLGWQFNKSEGTTSSGPVLTDRVTTKSGFLRLAGRYRFTPSWELGLLQRVLFGADTRFQTAGAVSDNVNWLAGIEAVYRLPLALPLQLSGAFLTDVTVSNRQIYQLLFGVQVGIPLPAFSRKAGPAAVYEPAPPVAPAPEKETARPPEAAECPPQAAAVCPPAVPVERRYAFDLKRIQFDFDSDQIRPVSAPMLEALGAFLAEHPGAWEKLTVEGHTDRIGAAAYNKRLSERRAQSVRRALEAEGVAPDRLQAVGHGFSRPLAEETSPEARQKNRRVEFKLEGIREPEMVDDFFRRLNLEY